MNVFLQKPGAMLAMPSLLLFSIVLELLASIERQKNDIEDIQMRKEDIKLSLVVDDRVSVENHNLQQNS